MRAPTTLPSTDPRNPSSWKLERELGRGGGARVWLARVGKHKYSLKVAHPNLATQLASEAERLAFSVSPQLPSPVAAGRLDEPLPLPDGSEFPTGSAYLLLTFVEGAALSQVPPTADQAWRVAHDVARALADLHAAGVAHNDVKPANIIYCAASNSAKLIDLGLADAGTQTTVQGGTWRYLGADVTANTPAQTRDLAALGLTLLERLRPEVLALAQPFAQAEPFLASLDPHWRNLLSLLLGPAAARPSAEWLARQASRWLPRRPQAEGAVLRRARVQRAYLATRAGELLQVSRGRAPRISATGVPGQWLEDCCAVLRGVASLRGSKSDETQVFGALSGLQRRKWLLRLIGITSVDFPVLPPQTDDHLAERLLELVDEREPESLSIADLATASALARCSPPEDPRDLALLLGGNCQDSAVLDQAEKLASDGTATLPFLFALSDTFRRRHELGRALFVLSHAEPNQDVASVATRRAAVFLRAGDFAAADAALTPWSDAPAAAAVLSRLRLAQGNLDGAEQALQRGAIDADTTQANASVKLTRGDLAGAENELKTALGFALNDEQRSRNDALLANLAQQRGHAEEAHARFVSAAEHAAQAGALVEEATYLSGVASTASGLGRIAETLAAARRATLLFEYLGRPEAAARAALARAGAFTMVGANAEATDAAREALDYARAGGDARCLAFTHLVLCDVNDASREDQLERAETLLSKLPGGIRTDDRLRLAARHLRLGHSINVTEYDQLASVVESADVRLEWWGQRAQHLLTKAGTETTDATDVLTQLARLLPHRASVEARGFAFAFGTQLAAEYSQGDRARQLSQAAGQALQSLRSTVPPELAQGVEQLAWAKLIRSPRETLVTSEQLSDLETLIIGLGERDQLKPVLNRALDALVLWTGVERGLLLLRAPGGGLVPRAARNLARSDLAGEQLRLSTTLAQRALERGECVVAVDAAGELPELHESVHSLRLRSVLAIPLLARGDVLGVAYLDDRMRRGAFGPRELSWVRLVATLAALAIADTRDQLLLKRAARKARRAERKLKQNLATRDAELEVIEKELAYTKNVRGTRFSYDEVIGNSEPIRRMLRLVDRLSQSDVPVLISGDSGSGKELVARALHKHSSRKNKAFVTENCSAIPEPLLESALFGHIKGAFTGASSSRAGLFEIAHQGSLFLDEIGDMSLAMQSKLLRVIETGELRRVGAEREIKVDVRIIAASHKVLEDLVKQGLFREDLFYRLNVVAVRVPPLKERVSDIPLLVRHFVRKHAEQSLPPADREMATHAKPSQSNLPRFGDAAMQAMMAYDWPGNVRQLENETRRALVLCEGEIQKHDLSPVLRGLDSGPSGALNLRQRLDALEAELVANALGETAGNQTQAAQLLGISRFGLQKMVKRLGIQYDGATGQARRVSVTEN